MYLLQLLQIKRTVPRVRTGKNRYQQSFCRRRRRRRVGGDPAEAEGGSLRDSRGIIFAAERGVAAGRRRQKGLGGTGRRPQPMGP